MLVPGSAKRGNETSDERAEKRTVESSQGSYCEPERKSFRATTEDVSQISIIVKA